MDHNIATLCLVVMVSSCTLNAQTPETKYPRVYGNKGRPIERQKKLPAWVTEQIGGAELDTKYKNINDATRPLVVVLCREFTAESKLLYQSLDCCAVFGDFSIYVVVTDEKGIAAEDDPALFPEAQYHSKESFDEFAAKLKKVFEKFRLSNTTIAVARNRHLYKKHAGEITVAFIRGQVEYIREFDSHATEKEHVVPMLKAIGDAYRESSNSKGELSPRNNAG